MAKKDLDKVLHFDILGDFLLQFTDIDNSDRVTSIFSVRITSVERVTFDPIITGAALSRIIIELKDERFSEIVIGYTNNEQQALSDYQKIINLMIINRIKNRR